MLQHPCCRVCVWCCLRVLLCAPLGRRLVPRCTRLSACRWGGLRYAWWCNYENLVGMKGRAHEALAEFLQISEETGSTIAALGSISDEARSTIINGLKEAADSGNADLCYEKLYSLLRSHGQEMGVRERVGAHASCWSAGQCA